MIVMINFNGINISFERNKLHVNYLKHGKLTLEDAHQIIKTSTQLLFDNNVCKAPLIISSERNISYSDTAKAYLASKEVNEKLLCIAIIAANSFQALVANLFISLNSPMVPTKLFFNRESALSWADEKIRSEYSSNT